MNNLTDEQIISFVKSGLLKRILMLEFEQPQSFVQTQNVVSSIVSSVDETLETIVKEKKEISDSEEKVKENKFQFFHECIDAFSELMKNAVEKYNVGWESEDSNYMYEKLCGRIDEAKFTFINTALKEPSSADIVENSLVDLAVASMMLAKVYTREAESSKCTENELDGEGKTPVEPANDKLPTKKEPEKKKYDRFTIDNLVTAWGEQPPNTWYSLQEIRKFAFARYPNISPNSISSAVTRLRNDFLMLNFTKEKEKNSGEHPFKYCLVDNWETLWNSCQKGKLKTKEAEKTYFKEILGTIQESKIPALIALYRSGFRTFITASDMSALTGGVPINDRDLVILRQCDYAEALIGQTVKWKLHGSIENLFIESDEQVKSIIKKYCLSINRFKENNNDAKELSENAVAAAIDKAKGKQLPSLFDGIGSAADNGKSEKISDTGSTDRKITVISTAGIPEDGCHQFSQYNGAVVAAKSC